MYIGYAIMSDGSKQAFCAENVLDAAEKADKHMQDGAYKVEFRLMQEEGAGVEH